MLNQALGWVLAHIPDEFLIGIPLRAGPSVFKRPKIPYDYQQLPRAGECHIEPTPIFEKAEIRFLVGTHRL